ncbi:MAG: type III-A CRISPR-associated protein Csm2 [Treponemataceae bacterium]
MAKKQNRNQGGGMDNRIDSYQPLKSFYVDKDRKNVDPKLFNEIAEGIAMSFCKQSRKNKGDQTEVSLKGEITITQLRRLFDEVKRFDQLVETKSWDEIAPYIKMINSKVRYTVARMKKTNRYSSEYYENLDRFMSDALKLVNDKNSYLVFSKLFEAVYGFYYGYTS